MWLRSALITEEFSRSVLKAQEHSWWAPVRGEMRLVPPACFCPLRALRPPRPMLWLRIFSLRCALGHDPRVPGRGCDFELYGRSLSPTTPPHTVCSWQSRHRPLGTVQGSVQSTRRDPQLTHLARGVRLGGLAQGVKCGVIPSERHSWKGKATVTEWPGAASSPLHC